MCVAVLGMVSITDNVINIQQQFVRCSSLEINRTCNGMHM